MRRAQAHPAARFGIAGRIGEQVRYHLRHAHRIAVAPQAGLNLGFKMVGTLLEQRAGHLDRLAQHLRQGGAFDAQHDLAARDARDVEQVVHQAHQVLDLALDDLALARMGVLAAHAHQLQRGDDRRQRVAQLVAQHRQELVLGLAGRGQLDLTMAAPPASSAASRNSLTSASRAVSSS
jgi:hypothetical protein